jgi:hypothetical protein
MYLESIQFKGPYNVKVSGYVWQLYANDVPKYIDKGVEFPEAEYSTLEQVYSGRQGDEELIGWSFSATLRQQSNYQEYPLDRQQIWILLWHPDFEHDVYLVPDLESYTTLDPTSFWKTGRSSEATSAFATIVITLTSACRATPRKKSSPSSTSMSRFNGTSWTLLSRKR